MAMIEMGGLAHSSTCQLINLSTHQLFSSSTCQLINLSTHQLINSSARPPPKIQYMLMRRHADDMAICNVGTLAYQHVLFLNLHLNTLTAEFLHSLVDGLVVFGSYTEFGQVERGKGIV